MTSPESDLLFDKAIDDALSGSSTGAWAVLDTDDAALLLLGREVHAALEPAPPPPHGLRPGRSAFLTAALTHPPRRRSFGSSLGRMLNWGAPAVAVVLLALLLTFMFGDGGRRLPSIIPGSAPERAQSNTPLLFPEDTPTPTPTATPTPTPTPTSTPTPRPTSTATPASTPTPAAKAAPG